MLFSKPNITSERTLVTSKTPCSLRIRVHSHPIRGVDHRRMLAKSEADRYPHLEPNEQAPLAVHDCHGCVEHRRASKSRGVAPRRANAAGSGPWSLTTTRRFFMSPLPKATPSQGYNSMSRCSTGKDQPRSLINNAIVELVDCELALIANMD